MPEGCRLFQRPRGSRHLSAAAPLSQHSLSTQQCQGHNRRARVHVTCELSGEGGLAGPTLAHTLWMCWCWCWCWRAGVGGGDLVICYWDVLVDAAAVRWTTANGGAWACDDAVAAEDDNARA